MVKSTDAYLVEEFGVSRCALYKTLNTIFMPLKFRSLKHLWGLIHNGDINN